MCRWCVSPRKQCLLLDINVTDISVRIFCLLAVSPTGNLELCVSLYCTKIHLDSLCRIICISGSVILADTLCISLFHIQAHGQAGVWYF